MSEEIEREFDEEANEVDPSFYSVAVYLEDLCWGGPEEGGWYYSAFYFTPSFGHHTRSFKTRAEAREYQTSLDPLIAELNTGRPALHSVLSEGRYTTLIVDELPLREYPTRRPHYE